jgi:hypothetical protein
VPNPRTQAKHLTVLDYCARIEARGALPANRASLIWVTWGSGKTARAAKIAGVKPLLTTVE